MSTQDRQLNNSQLDAALDTLRAPVPSDTLVQRVRGMAPARRKTFMTPQRAAAAALVMAIGVATVLHMANSGNVAPTMAVPASPPPIAAVADPAGEIPISDVALGDDASQGNTSSAEPFSIAGMPLE